MNFFVTIFFIASFIDYIILLFWELEILIFDTLFVDFTETAPFFFSSSSGAALSLISSVAAGAPNFFLRFSLSLPFPNARLFFW